MQTVFFLIGLAIGASWGPTRAWAKFGSKLDHQTLRERCRAYRHLDRQTLAKAPPVGSVAYYPTGAIEAGQTRFSFKQLRKAMRKAIKTRVNEDDKDSPRGAHYDKHLRTWIFAHDDHRSIFPLKKAAGAVYYDGRLYLFDGHHKALTSTYLRAPRMPIKVEANWSHLTKEQFIKNMRERPYHYAHWRDYQGADQDPVDLSELANDPNLLLARLLLLRVDVDLNEAAACDALENPGTENEPGVWPSAFSLGNIRGAERPIAIKINNDIPFFEFEIADALRRHGVHFDESRREQDLSLPELREYAKILWTERKRPDSRLRQILLLDEPKSSSKLNLHRLVKDHMSAVDCRRYMKAAPED